MNSLAKSFLLLSYNGLENLYMSPFNRYFKCLVRDLFEREGIPLPEAIKRVGNNDLFWRFREIYNRWFQTELMIFYDEYPSDSPNILVEFNRRRLMGHLGCLSYLSDRRQRDFRLNSFMEETVDYRFD
jgi:hypothetical protein